MVFGVSCPDRIGGSLANLVGVLVPDQGEKVIFIFGGLPGTGKTELSIHLAKKIGGLHLRIDTLEQALRDAGIKTIGGIGYAVAYKIATDNLKLGLPVIADSVNPLNVTREAWREVARQADVAFREIEVICSDKDEHRHRVETRQTRISGLELPTWKDTVEREYDLWLTPHIVIDTAGQSTEESKQALERLLGI